MNFETKKLKIDLSLAETLRALRKNHGLSLEQLSQELQVQLRYLRNLERGDYAQLPAPVYLKGFLKRYADFFTTPFKDLWQLYDQERAVVVKLEKKPSQYTAIIQPLKSLRPLLTPKILIISFASLTFLSLLGYFAYQISFLIKPPALVIDSPADDLITWDNNLVLMGRASSNAQLLINDQPIQTTKDGLFEYSLVLAQGMNTIRLVAENPFGKKTEILRRVMLK